MNGERATEGGAKAEVEGSDSGRKHQQGWHSWREELEGPSDAAATRSVHAQLLEPAKPGIISLPLLQHDFGRMKTNQNSSTVNKIVNCELSTVWFKNRRRIDETQQRKQFK